MSDIAVSVRGVSKSYTIAHDQQKPSTLVEALIRRVKDPFHRPTTETFWALKDVSFDIKKGDVVGIIGRNGAGKSTLLKILSRITEPTEGEIHVFGRIGSLLEVGTGFHPELTGRENVFLNGAILGMGKSEIRRQFDAIVDFAGVEKFLDTPVKRYSSGMYVRLAFAVAAHLNSEILIVDEVLAVGDAAFQKKCMAKMEEVAKQGRTLFFVSHNLAAIGAICPRSIYLKTGMVVADAATETVMREYMGGSAATAQYSRSAPTAGVPTVMRAAVTDAVTDEVKPSIQLDLWIQTSSPKPVSIDLRITDSAFVPVAFSSLGALDPSQMVDLRAGVNHVTIQFGSDRLGIGTYLVSIDLTTPGAEYFDRIDNALRFDVQPRSNMGNFRSLEQGWGYGSMEIPLLLSGITTASL